MKKLTAFLLTLCLAFTFFALPAAAAGATERRNLIEFEELAMSRMVPFCIAADSSAATNTLGSAVLGLRDDGYSISSVFGLITAEPENLTISDVFITFYNDSEEIDQDIALRFAAAMSALEYDHDGEVELELRYQHGLSKSRTPINKVTEVINDTILPLVGEMLDDSSTWGEATLVYSGNYDYYILIVAKTGTIYISAEAR